MHGYNRLLKVADENLKVFSKKEFKKRKIAEFGDAFWINERTNERIPITKARILEIRKYLSKYEREYRSFENIRHRYYAHKICVDALERQRLFSNAKIKKIERIIQALANAHEGFWQGYVNGKKRRINLKNTYWEKHAKKETRTMILRYANVSAKTKR